MYSAIAQEHFTNPRNAGTLERPTHEGMVGTPGDGPYMVMQFAVVDGIIERAAFRTYGCPSALACGSMTTTLVVGRPVAVALRLGAEDLLRVLGGLPEGKGHCAEMAVQALIHAFQEENRT